MMKLNISKAYDWVEWFFLENMMLCLGFDGRWVELIMRCVRSVSYSFLINRKVQRSLVPTRGILQGDPFAPNLFVICAHGLFEMFTRVEDRQLIRGVKITRGSLPIIHLFFIDDSLIFWW